MLLGILLPRRCASCEQPARAILCDGCAAEVLAIEPPMCARCGAPMRTGSPAPGAAPARVVGSGAACPECRRLGGPAFASARSAVLYTGPARDALIAFKVLGERRAARDLAAAMRLARDPATTALPVTFVPSGAAAMRDRGFNPAERLARAFAPRGGVVALLRKRIETPDLSGLSRAERVSVLAGAFEALRPPPVSVVLVDDVMTTGATATACAVALTRAGARSVHVLTYARVPPPRTMSRPGVSSGSVVEADGASRPPSRSQRQAKRPT